MGSLWGDGDCFPEEFFPQFAWIILLCLHSALQSFQFEVAIFVGVEDMARLDGVKFWYIFDHMTFFLPNANVYFFIFWCW